MNDMDETIPQEEDLSGTPSERDAAEIPRQIGPWVVQKKIGAGGMGSVYLGVHEESGEEAAVKVLPASLAREPGFIARFSREVESMKTLKNPYIVNFIESGVAENETHYYAMEYVEGETLTGLLRRQTRLPWEQVVEFTLQICVALKSAHDSGIVHRDLKPSNLLIDRHGNIKLTDFGVAQVFAAGKLTVTGGIIGTAEFMSPEQAQGHRASKKSDLYSLGAVMYAMLTGRPPFSGKTTLDVIQKHKFGQFDRPNMYVPEIPLWLNDLVCQLLEKEPDKRFPDAYVLSRRLQEMYNRHKEKQTLAEGDATDSATVVSDAGYDPSDPNATLMRDMMRAQIEQEYAKGKLGGLLDNTYVLLLLLVLIVSGAFYFMRNVELTPEERFAAGQHLMESDSRTERLQGWREYLEPLWEEAPEEWNEKILPYYSQAEKDKASKPRLVNGKLVKGDLAEPERLLQLAEHYRSVGDIDRALAILESLDGLLEGNPQQDRLQIRIEEQLRTLRELRTAAHGLQDFLEQALDRARAASDSGDAETATRICRSIVVLYGQNEHAASYVKTAQEFLDRRQ
ncbi:MAG TPA: serine/threonine-protein kinase [Planctomycetaceae bacterium]|nr:serine/threonine-protein kinase [Planctomycetaceae bacterium]